jgi:hypothetical protein
LKIYFAKGGRAFYSKGTGETAMPKVKKSDSEKAPKDKSLKILKAEKPAKEKKKDKAAIELKPAKSVVEKSKKAAEAHTGPSLEEISLRAYFIAERRQAMGWPGDSTSDWVEAERQLKSESRRKAKA